METLSPRGGRVLLLALMVLLEVVAVRQAGGQVLQVNPAAITMRRMHPEQYQPEQRFSCTLILDGMDTRNLKAMGIRETIPAGWEFAGLAASDAPPPAVVPPAGATGTLEFAWVELPATFPYTLVYTVRPLADAAGQQFFHGAVEYRLLGGPQYAPPVVTSVSGPDQPPTLTLLGDNPMEIAEGTPWSEPGYTARDSRGQEVTSQVRVSGSVDTETAGTYSLEYRLELPGQQAVTATRTVIVTEVNHEPANPTPPVRRTGGVSSLPPPVEGRRNSELSPSRQEPGTASGTSDQSPSTGSREDKPVSGPDSPLPELPSLDHLRPLSGTSDRSRQAVTIGLTPEQQAALPPEALRPYPPKPDVEPDTVRANILRAMEEEEEAQQARQTAETAAAPLSAPAGVPPKPLNRMALGLGIGVALILGGSGVLAGKLVYRRSAWRRPRHPFTSD